jgi:hypothetical protein
MITNERELESTLAWLDYWRENRSGEQSWIGNEQARQRVSELRRQIDDYRRRTGGRQPAPARATPQKEPEATTRAINRAALLDYER